MKLLVFGANGRVGRMLTAESVSRGYDVTAFVRNKSKMGLKSKKLKTVEGDATNYSAVAAAVRGHDAVISVLGHGKNTDAEMQSNAMRAITSAMRKHGVKRIVSLTGYNIFTNGDVPTLYDHLTAGALMFFDQKRFQDGIKHVEVLKDSSCDWVALRTPKHRNARGVSDYTLRPTIKGASLTVSRPNIVDCLLSLAESKKISSRMPVISD